ncbi:GDP-mannose 4,6-dehydratase [Acidiplasma aeolicum]|jgi:GDPmannose 4,6-dehydratase|uniref:GDP-mannose 4,6-dehydratase n=1 Tax=Acidiplasma aeolicum TaxID=507754 RepID=UPI003713619B
MKSALITGITGQDGAYLAKLLLSENYKVYGLYRRISTPNFWRLQSLDIYDKINLISGDLNDMSSIINAINASNPDEIYHLAAQSFVEASFESPLATAEVTGLSTTRILEAVKLMKLDSKVYYAGTSEMYGSSYLNKSLNESDVFQPMSPYAAAKLYGYWISRIYRDGYNIFVSSGILFNHESEIRGMEFVTRKIANQVAKISLGLENKIYLGNIEAKRDWGYAPEYVEAMHKMLEYNKPDDFVIATDETHTVKEFLEYAFDYINDDYNKYLEIDKRFVRPLDVPALKGDYSKAKEELNWSPKTRFKDIVKIMVGEEIKRWKKYLNGDQFPWDVPNYPNENNLLKTYRGHVK